MRYTITKIEPLLYNRTQYVKIYLKERTDSIAFSYDYVFKYLWQLRTTELELLIDSYLEPIYFQKGDILRNGGNANSSNYHIKMWTLLLYGTQIEIREKNNHLCPIFQTLYDTYIYNRKGKDEVRIRTTMDIPYFVELNQLIKFTGLEKEEFNLLTGAFISPIYYKDGEISEKTERPIYGENKIIKNLNIRVVKTIDYNFQLFGKQILESNTPLVNDNFSDSELNDDEFDYDDNSSSKYEKYNGYNGYDDFTIDAAFEGDPEATWNVD